MSRVGGIQSRSRKSCRIFLVGVSFRIPGNSYIDYFNFLERITVTSAAPMKNFHLFSLFDAKQFLEV